MPNVGRVLKVKEINLTIMRSGIDWNYPHGSKVLGAQFNFEGIADGRLSDRTQIDMNYVVALLRWGEYGIRPTDQAHEKLSIAMNMMRTGFIEKLREASMARRDNEKVLRTTAYDYQERVWREQNSYMHGHTKRSFKEEMKRGRR